MEEVCTRFPHLARDIIKKIDHLSLTRFKVASRDICKFLESGRFIWKQMISKDISGNHNLFTNLDSYSPHDVKYMYLLIDMYFKKILLVHDMQL